MGSNNRIVAVPGGFPGGSGQSRGGDFLLATSGDFLMATDMNGRCTMVVERRATRERVPIPLEVRDEFIAIQLAARELC